MKTVKTYAPKDADGIRAMRVVMEANIHLSLLEHTLPTETYEVLAAAVEELRWTAESRARWMTACQMRQISIHEEERS
jgi:hypothetical protein